MRTYIWAWMICHSSVVAKGDVFLFPVFAESVGGLFVELALFHRDGATRAERPCSVGAAAVAVRFATRSTSTTSSRGVAFTIHLLFAGSEQVGPPSVFPNKKGVRYGQYQSKTNTYIFDLIKANQEPSGALPTYTMSGKQYLDIGPDSGIALLI